MVSYKGPQCEYYFFYNHIEEINSGESHVPEERQEHRARGPRAKRGKELKNKWAAFLVVNMGKRRQTLAPAGIQFISVAPRCAGGLLGGAG